MSRKHALLSPSGAHRWMVCTPSARLTEHINTSSTYADEGTCAHDLIDVLLKDAFELIVPRVYAAELIAIQRNEYYTGAMFDYCYAFATFIKEKYNAYVAKGKTPTILIEAEVNYSFYVKEGSGYVDVVIYTENEISISDFKYGQGVPVAAEENEQMMLYALGVDEKLIYSHDIEMIELNIYQPRIDNISTWALPRQALIEWAKNVVAPAAKAAWAGEGELKPGDHCRFCGVRATCRALAQENVYQAAERFKEPFEAEQPALLSDEELAELLGKLDQIKSWADAVKAYALEQALKGKNWPGYKLVRGRSNRTYIDEKEVINLLVNQHAYKKGDITTTSVLPITKMEAYLGKNTFEKLLSQHIVKPKGAPVLVETTDKRIAISADAAQVFDDELDFG